MHALISPAASVLHLLGCSPHFVAHGRMNVPLQLDGGFIEVPHVRQHARQLVWQRAGVCACGDLTIKTLQHAMCDACA
jgi:hypothetical protein